MRSRCLEIHFASPGAIFLAIFIFAACGSSDKKAPPVNEGSNSAQIEEPQEANKSAEPAPSRPADNSGPALNDAIKAQSDEPIYHAATAVLSQKPNDVVALNAVGLYHLHKGRPLAAQIMFVKALLARPNSSEIHSNLGLVHLALKENAEAIRAFRKALSLNPSDAIAAGNLGSIYLAQRDFAKAYSVLSLGTDRSRDAKSLNNLAIASASQGKLDQAESLYRKSLKLASNDPQILMSSLLNYAIFQIDYQHQYKDGLETLNRLKILGPAEAMKNQTNTLEIRAKAGLK